MSLILLFALPWLLPFFTIAFLARREFELTNFAPLRGRPVSVIIPARNETETIETVVRSVLASDYSPLEVLVIDDRSTDDTAAIVTGLAAADSRVRLIPGSELPAGWYGKPWACLQGFRAATGEILVFTDADTRHQPALLAHAVGALVSVPADLVTISPQQKCVTFWERIVMPQIWLLLGLRYHPSRVNAARSARDVIANGQFIMTTRSAYERAGTHAAVHDKVAEDLALAQTYFRAGLRVYFAFAETLMETRMYRGLGHLVEGWSKNVYLGARESLPDNPRLRAMIPLLFLAGLVYALTPVTLLALSVAGLTPGWMVVSALATGLQVVFWGLVSFGMRIPIWYGLLYPAGALVAGYIFLRSTVRGGRRVEWKGRVYGAVGGKR
ncbi:MAG: glycosyltransferase family 2 protein [Gemmatimonadota bacterium]